MKWPFPAENQDPWFDSFEDMVSAVDASGHAAREDRNVWMGGGGTVSWDATLSTLSWTEDLEIYSTEVGFLHTIPAGNVSLQDGQLFYVDLVRRPTGNVTVSPTAASQVPSTDTALAIAIRRGDDIYFRFGAKIADGESFDIFQGGGGSSSGDTYERSATFAVPDGSSSSQEATLGRITYQGSIVGLSLDLTEPVNSGSITVTVKRNGVDTLIAVLDAGTPSNRRVTTVVGTHPTGTTDEITVLVEPSSYDNVSGIDGGLTVNVTFTTGASQGPTDIPDASDTIKGVTKLSTAAALASNPIAVGDNDARVQAFTRSGSNVVIQNQDDLTRVGSIQMDQNTGNDHFLEISSGSGAGVAPANRGRIRYNQATQKWQFSENGGAYQDFGAGGGTDPDAIHDNVAGEIAAIAAKSPLVSADIILVEDSAAANAKKSATIGDIRITESQITDLDHTDVDAIHDNISGEIAAVTEKATPVAADLLLIEDSEDSNNKKRVQVGNLPGSGGGRKHIKTFRVTSAPQDTLTFDGLDGDADGVYVIEAVFIAANSATAAFINPNGLKTNQSGASIFLDSTPGQNLQTELPFWASSATVANFAGTGQLFARTGRVRSWNFQGEAASGGAYWLVAGVGRWTDTAANITSLVIDTNVANGIGIGSEFRLYKLTEVTGQVEEL